MADKAFEAVLERGRQEKQREFEQRCESDSVFDLENNFNIRLPNTNQFIPFKPLRMSQLKLEAIIRWAMSPKGQKILLHKTGGRIQILVGKSRKTGISTWCQCHGIRRCMKEGIRVLTISYNERLTTDIFEIGKDAYDQYQLSKPDLVRNQTAYMQLANGGVYAVDYAGNSNAGSGTTPQFLHWSETDKSPNAAAVDQAAAAAVPKKPGCVLIYETTMKNYNAVFEGHWKPAIEQFSLTWKVRRGKPVPKVQIKDIDKWNGWIPMFISMTDNPEDKLPFRDDAHKEAVKGSLTTQEIRYMDEQGAGLETINWIREIFITECAGDEARRRQEYPMFPEEMFVSTRFHRLNRAALEERFQPIEGMPIRGYLKERSGSDSRIIFIEDPSGWLELYVRPIPNHDYVFWVDPVEGDDPERILRDNRDPDEGVLQILDKTNGNEQVALIDGHMTEEDFAPKLTMTAAWFNYAFGGPERGGGFGTYIATYLKNNYPKDRLYRDEQDRKVGYKMTNITGPGLVKDAAEIINQRNFLLHSPKTFRQCVELLKTKGDGGKAPSGRHDDHFYALAGALKCATDPRFPRINRHIRPFAYPQSIESIRRPSYDWDAII